MKPENRRQQIIELLVEERSASLDALARRFDVSKMTIHRDLDDLEAAGLLRKQRGGATIEPSSRFESDIRFRTRKAVSEKRRIARFAAEFVEPGMSVLIDDSSTARAAVPFLTDKRPLTIVTNNLAAMSDLAGQGGITLIALGGTYSGKFDGFFGILTQGALAGLRVDIGLLSTSSIDGTTAFHQDQAVVAVKRRMIASAARCYLLVDHQKFGRTALHRLADLDAFDGVVTSDALDPDLAQLLTDQGIALHFAKEE